MTEQEPEETCRPVEVDGEIIDVFGREEMTEEDRGHFTEIVRAAKRKAEADDRARFAEARQHGLKARHETRVERAIREDPMKALRYLLAQYDRIVEVHEHVVMDTPEDRELHGRAIATFREAAEPIRTMLAKETS